VIGRGVPGRCVDDCHFAFGVGVGLGDRVGETRAKDLLQPIAGQHRQAAVADLVAVLSEADQHVPDVRHGIAAKPHRVRHAGCPGRRADANGRLVFVLPNDLRERRRYDVARYDRSNEGQCRLGHQHESFPSVIEVFGDI
jgi:hypothetical protein